MKYYRNLWIGLFGLVLNVLPFKTAVTQSFRFIEISEKDGLSSNKAKCIYKDYQGFIWIGTADGLNCYDGVGFTIFTHKHSDTSSISNNDIKSVCEDADNNLWITTRMGINRFNRNDHTFKNYYHNPDDESTISSNDTRKLLLDSKNNLWICTGYGLNKLVKNGGNEFYFRHYFPKLAFADTFKRSESAFQVICEDSKGNLWTGTWGGGLMLFDPEKGTFKHYQHEENNPNSILSNIVVSIAEINNGNIWAGSYFNGLNIFDPISQTFRHYKNDPYIKNQLDSSKRITAILTDNNKNIWLGTLNDLYLFKGSIKNKFYMRKGHNNLQYYKSELHKAEINQIYEDNTGIIWVVSETGGIDRYDPKQDKFSRFYVDLHPAEQRDHIKAFVEDEKQNLWLPTFGDGLIYCDKKGKIIQRYTIPQIQNNELSTVCIDKNGMIWAGGTKGLDMINPLTNKVKRSYNYKSGEINGLSNSTIRGLAIAPDGLLWVLTLKDIHVIDPDNGEFINCPLADKIKIKILVWMKKDSDNNLLFYGKGGVAIVDVIKKQIRYLRYNAENYSNGLCDNDVDDVLLDSEGVFWIATKGGLNSYSSKTNQFKHYLREDGLATDIINNIAEVKNEIWIKTPKSISRLNKKNGQISNYFKSDGIHLDGGAIHSDSAGFIYVASEGGFFRFQPNDIPKNEIPPPVFFTNIQINGIDVSIGPHSLLKKHISLTDKIRLNHTHKTIHLTFVALNYTQPEKNRYKYKLEGFNERWHDIGNRNDVSFTNLAPGNYTLLVKAANNDQVWNPKPARLELIVSPPWWQTWWAVISFVFVFSFVFFILRFFNIRKERIISEMKRVRELNQMKLRFFTNISHEFKTPLSLIINPLENTLKENKLDNKLKKRIELSFRNAKHLLNLVNQIMDLRKIETPKIPLYLAKTEIISCIRSIANQFFYELENRGIHLLITSSMKELNVSIDKAVIQKIVMNLLSNAIRYTPPNGEVKINVKYENLNNRARFRKNTNINKSITHFLIISVADSGKGIPESEKEKVFERFYCESNKGMDSEGTGIGLHLIKELVLFHHGTIEVSQNIPNGTIFTVSIPVQKPEMSTIEDTTKIEFITKKLVLPEKTIIKKENQDGHTLLIVEDNEEMLHYISAILSEEKYNILGAENGRIGVDKALQNIPDVIISDVMMPEMDGIELCKTLKSNRQTSHISIILLTAKSLIEHQLEGYETGADGYITKPLNEKLLKVLIKNLLSNREKIKAYFKSVSYKNLEKAPVDSPIDKKFLQDVEEILKNNYMDENFSVNEFARLMKLSPSQLYRKFMHFIGVSTGDYIRTYRLNKAAELLKSSPNPSVSEVAFQTGFKHATNFTRSFQKHFNMLPKDFIDS